MQITSMKDLTREIISAAIEVQRVLGTGLLESAYEECLCHEIMLRKIPYQRQLTLPVVYKGLHVEQGYRVDLLIADRVVVEVKAVEELLPVHAAQLLTYLRLGDWRVGLLINFHHLPLSEGIVRLVNNYHDS